MCQSAVRQECSYLQMAPHSAKFAWTRVATQCTFTRKQTETETETKMGKTVPKKKKSTRAYFRSGMDRCLRSRRFHFTVSISSRCAYRNKSPVWRRSIYRRYSVFITDGRLSTSHKPQQAQEYGSSSLTFQIKKTGSVYRKEMVLDSAVIYCI